MSETIISAKEDIDAFWRNLGSRDKLYTVKVGDIVCREMTLTYCAEDGSFLFKKVSKNE
jgi:hypothetical protein